MKHQLQNMTPQLFKKIIAPMSVLNLGLYNESES